MQIVKLVLAVVCTLVLAVAHAQDASLPDSLFSTVRSDVAIIVREHDTGAENVEVTVLAPNYPSDLLRGQCEAVGTYTGTAVRGLVVLPRMLEEGNPNFRFLVAQFATNGLIDRTTGVLRVEPLLKAFAGAAAPFTTVGLSIAFENEEPNSQTIRKFRLPDILEAEGRYSLEPKGTEYRIRLLTQDPAKIRFPEKQEPLPVDTAPKPAAQAGFGVAFWVAFVVAGLAIVLLVYLALLRAGSRAPR